MKLNQFKALIKNIQDLFFRNVYKNNQKNDEELECLQFGICAVQVQSPRPEELFFR